MADRKLIYHLAPQDVLDTFEKVRDAIESGQYPADFENQSDFVRESRVVSLCTGCDHFLGVDAGCEVAGKNDQRRYAAGGNCGWASVDGQRTTRTV